MADGIREPLMADESIRGDQWMVYLSTFVAVCGSYEFGCCVSYSSPTQSAIREDLNLTLAEYSVVGSILTLGAMVGAITTGPIADFLGRKGALRMSSAFCVAGWLAIYFSEGVLSLDIGRMVSGYGMGAFSYLVPVFIAEIAPKNLRGRLTAVNQLMICVGSSVSFIIGVVVSWRALALIGIVPCAVTIFGLFFIPESPRWLAKTGRHKDFEAALQKLRGKDADISHEAAEIQDYIATLERLPKAKLLDLFQSRYLRSVVIGIGLMVCQQLGGINGVGFYVSDIFEQAGFSSSVGTISFAVLQVVVTGIGASLMDKAGRKPLIVLSASGLVLGSLLTAISFFLKVHDLAHKASPILAVTGILVYIGSFAIGMGAVPWVIMSEIFPINIKGQAGSVATLVNWFGAWLCSYTFNYLMSWSSYGMAIEDLSKNAAREEMREPLVRAVKAAADGDGSGHGSAKGDQWMVYLSTFVAVCGSYEFGCGVGYSSPTQSGIMKDLGLSLAEYSMFGSILTFGAMIGAITIGPITDFLGRKGALRMSCVFCVAGWLAIYFSKGAVLLDVGRVATGYGSGAFSYIVPVFVAEIAPKNLRGRLTAVNQLMIVSGVSVSFIIGVVVHWRALALIGIVPCAVVIFGLFFIPESPRWLAKTGRRKEFEVALQKLRGKDADISDEAAEIQEYIATLDRLPQSKLLDLFQRRYLRSVIIAVGLMVCQQLGGINGVCFYVSDIFEQAGFSPDIGTITYAILQVVVTGLGAAVMDKAGRKPLILASASGLILGCVLVAISFFLKVHELVLDAAPIFAVAGILIFIGSFSIGMGAVPWVIMSEIFPINIKGQAGSLTTLVNWVGAWLCSYTFNFLMSWNSYGTFILYAVVNVLAVLFVVAVVPETKGKTLEQIQGEINN